MKNLDFCPSCGEKSLSWDNLVKWQCNSCSFVLYNNTAAAVAVVIKCKNELFFTVRNKNPGKGKLDLSGGFCDPKETAEETCCRELKEELDLKINSNNLRYLGSQPNVYPYKDITYNTMDLFYLYEVDEKFDSVMEKDEIADVTWINISDINLEDLAFESQKIFLEKYLNR